MSAATETRERTLEERVTILEAKVEQITSILLALHGATRQLRDLSDEWTSQP